MAQHYPPENLPGPGLQFETGVIDDISGKIVRFNRATRDLKYRIVDACDVDIPDREDIQQQWVPPTEAPPPII